jgi:hypothetical protein
LLVPNRTTHLATQ